VLTLLADDDEFMRRCAVEILNLTKDPRALASLIAALDDPDWWVRERALDALANMRDARAIPAIQRFLDLDNEGTPVAIRALATIGDPSVAMAIAAKLASTDEAIVREAIGALETLTDAKSAEGVLQALAELRAREVAADLVECATRAHAAITAKVRGRELNGNSGPKSPSVPKPRPAVVAQSAQFEPSGSVTEPAAPRPVPPAPERARPVPEQAPAVAVGKLVAERFDLDKVTEGQVIGGRYKVKRELGRGGFGVVLLVEDQMVQEDLALKVISPHLTQDEVAIARMVHEVRYARKITHENVIRIHDFVSIGGTYAMSMEYFASEPLTRKIRRGHPVAAQDGLRFVRDILRGTAVAHAAGIVHRDLKPANVLIDAAGVLKIVDFGLAAAMSNSNSRVTRTGQLVGTASYMAPEQVRGLELDQRTDLYSLGVIMYEMFTSVVPYSADNPMAVLYQHLEGTKIAPRERNAEIPPALEAVILKAMAVKVEERYQSAAEMLKDIDSLMLKVAA